MNNPAFRLHIIAVDLIIKILHFNFKLISYNKYYNIDKNEPENEKIMTTRKKNYYNWEELAVMTKRTIMCTYKELEDIDKKNYHVYIQRTRRYWQKELSCVHTKN